MDIGPAWWVPGAHLQTAWARIARSRRLITFEREVLTTPDDDDLVLDHVAGPPATPRVLILHGLEGSAYSLHTQGLALLVARAGWRGTVLNFRSCARDARDIERRLPNRRPRLYHSGETGDLDYVVRTLVAREPATPIYALGFSLGGAVLLKWLGEVGRASAIRAAATISVPYDLAAAARFLERPVGRFYFKHFITRLRSKSLDLLARFPRETAHVDPDRVRRAQSFHEFDDCLTAPLHGFAGADDYYRRSSSLPFLAQRRGADALPEQRGRSADPRRIGAPRARRGGGRRALRDHALGRPHRLRVRPMALAPALLGGGTIDRVAPRGVAQRPEHVRRAAY